MSFEGRERFWSGLLRVVNQSPSTARASGATECQRSGVCCWRRPCELHPGDPELLAAHLGITTADLMRDYLVVDRLDHGVVLVPRRVQQEGGRYLTLSESYDIETPCVFLDQTGGASSCRVQDAKPAGGRQWVCTMTTAQVKAMPRHGWTPEALRALGFDGEVDDD